MTKNSPNLKRKIVTIVKEHTELWEIFQQFNRLWSDLFAIVYFLLTHLTCLYLYLFVFSETNDDLKRLNSPHRRFIFAFCFAVFAIICVFGSFAVSKLTSSMYDNFISVERLSSVNLTLLNKLKILNFMKRFGKLPLGVSIGGFFFIKQDFPIKVVETLYSAFSTLLQIRDLTKGTKCKIRIQSSMNSNTSLF
ncbi:uncharacterized protein LOC111614959 [Centruroides sculpturatus]|uniref:uncharacterized protein LOC111614959 n=1 Tax=Centruroides sculpturatus TaxID=218467 RepID=UPI000C6D533A|nr:uncharacterized protein LOC111614959 [Centruroides sculpturatus]